MRVTCSLSILSMGSINQKTERTPMLMLVNSCDVFSVKTLDSFQVFQQIILVLIQSMVLLKLFFSYFRYNYFQLPKEHFQNYRASYSILRSARYSNSFRFSSFRSCLLAYLMNCKNFQLQEESTRLAQALQTMSHDDSIQGKFPLFIAQQKNLHIYISMEGLQGLALNVFFFSCLKILDLSVLTNAKNQGLNQESLNFAKFCNLDYQSTGLIKVKQSLSLKKRLSYYLTLFFLIANQFLAGCNFRAFYKYQEGEIGLLNGSTSFSAKSLTSHKKEGKHFTISYMSFFEPLPSSLLRLTTSESEEIAFQSMLPMLLYIKQLESSIAIRNILVSAFSPYSREPSPQVSITIAWIIQPFYC